MYKKRNKWWFKEQQFNTFQTDVYSQLPQSRLVEQQISKDREGRTLSLDRNAFEDMRLQYEEVS